MAKKLLIDGGSPLNGTIAIDSSKNALLPIIAASIMIKGETVLKKVPKLSDINNLLGILASMGASVRWEKTTLHIDCTNLNQTEIQSDSVSKIRGSIFVLGAILARFKTACTVYPGGCTIGSRPIDLHLQGLTDLGVKVTEQGGKICCKLRGKNASINKTIFLDFPSVGATENLILASVLGKSQIRIVGCAREPEVTDLCNFLNAAGAMICGQGSNTITVQGVNELRGITYTAIPDRIITGSYLIAAAACGGSVTLTNTVPSHNENLISKLSKCHCQITCTESSITITSESHKKPLPKLSVQTSAFPGFPTDLQSQLTAFLSSQKGTFAITENLYENRFKYTVQLAKLGASVTVKDRQALVVGAKHLFASNSDAHPLALYAEDLRGGVALVIAALAANGTSTIHNADFICRGHASIETDLANLGANIICIEE